MRISTKPASFSTAYILAAIALIAFGALLLWLIPDASAEAKLTAVKELMFDPADVRPEPKEKYSYFGLVLISPVVLFLAAALARKWRCPQWAETLSVCFGGAFLACLLWFDPYWGNGLQSVVGRPVAVVVAMTICTVVLATRHVVAQRWIQWSVIAAGAGFIVIWRIVSVSSIDDFDTTHFDAVAYSVIQIARGATCLATVVPQYGCYGEFIAPILRLPLPSTLALTSIFALLMGISFIVVALSIRHLISRSALVVSAIIWLMPILNRVWVTSNEPNFQNHPVRMLFPALSLLLVLWWQRHQSIARAVTLGIFAGLGLVWNIDTGAVVVAALALLVVMTGSTALSWQRRRQLLLGLTYLVTCLVTVALCVCVLSLKSGQWLPLVSYLTFQRAFFEFGANMLPMAGPFSLWVGWIAVGLGILVLLSVRLQQGQTPDYRLEASGYLSILGIGLFSYFVGRSHAQVLALISWPFVVLTFVLLDRWLDSRPFARYDTWIGRCVLSLVLIVGLANWWIVGPVAFNAAQRHLLQAVGSVPAGQVSRQVEFIKATSTAEQRIAILAHYQATLYAESDLASPIPGMSWIEILRRDDATAYINNLLSVRPDQIYLGNQLCCEPVEAYSQWVGQSIPLLTQQYMLAEWDPDGQLMRLVPRGALAGAADLFEDRRTLELATGVYGFRTDEHLGQAVGHWHRPIGLPVRLPMLTADEFDVSVSVVFDHQQVAYATVLTTASGPFDGITLEIDGPGEVTLYVGQGDRYDISEPIKVDPGVVHQFDFAIRHNAMVLLVDGVQAYSGPSPRFASDVALVVGGAAGAERNLAGRLIELRVSGGAQLLGDRLITTQPNAD